MSVLLVEDDRLSLFVYAEFIRNITTDVYTAANGLEGLKIFKEVRPDIIITDIMMPKLDGLEMIRQIKQIDQQVKVIMISGHSEVEYFIRSIDLGVDGYLLKPVDNKRLENKINELGKNVILSQRVAETEKKFKDFAAMLPQIVFEADLQGKLTFVNKLALEKFDYTSRDIEKGLFLHDVISDVHEITQDNIQEIILSDKIYHEYEVECKTRGGNLFPALIYTSGIIENDKIVGIRGVMVDITTRKRMMEELKSLNLELEEKVKQRTLLLSNEIKEKEKAEKALIKAKEKAEESDQLKGIFLSNVSHEIQTPIKAIISFSNLLQAPNLDPKRRNELMSIIDSNSNALLNLTNDILEFTRLQSNTVKFFNINFELNLFLKELFPVFDSLKREESEKTIKLKFRQAGKGKPVMITSDPSRLRQIFTNLISNAFKYTHEGQVEYGYRVLNKTDIQFYVADTGLGISDEYQKKIFERFIQEPKPLSIKKEGSGLGLPITQSLIKMLNGRIWVESSLGKGSKFIFEIPDIIMKAESHPAEDKYMWTDKQVLIIEDEIQDYLSLEEILKNRVKIHFLNNVEQALEFCNDYLNIDVCLVSWVRGNDLSIIEQIKAKNSMHKVICLLDGKTRDKDKKVLREHFHGILSKPFDKDEVLMTLDLHLK